MDAPTFTPVSAGSRLYVSSVLPIGGFAGYWCSASAQWGASATLAQTWADVGGFYVFARNMPGDLTAFAAQLTQLAPRISPTGLVKALWLANADDSSWNYWSTDTLTALPQSSPDGTWALVTPARLKLGSYSLELAPGSRLSLQNGPNAFGVLLPAAAATFAHGEFSLPATGTVSLALAGTSVGAWSVPLTLRPQQPDPCDQLGVMLRYATTPDPNDAQATSFNLARYLSMPVLRLRAGSLSIVLRMDASAMLDPRRTYLDLMPGGTVPYALSSAFVTTLGYQATLTPRAGMQSARSARLAFCKSPIYAVEGPNEGNEVFHLAPDGCFSIGVTVPVSVMERRTRLAAKNGATEKDHWMFGNSGAEYATLDSSTGDIIAFDAGHAAYIPADPSVGTSPLRDSATTSYATVLPGASASDGLSYYAQPLQAPLFMAASDLGAGFLDFHPMLSGALPSQAQIGDSFKQWFPTGAYRWLDSDEIVLARSLEAAVLAPARRAIIGGVTDVHAQIVDAPPLAVTPQGLLAQLTGDGSAWAGVLFANLPASAQSLLFTPVGQRFAQALQSNQLFFAVADTKEFLQQSGVGPQGLNCTLDGWTFKLSPTDWRTGSPSDPTLMLFKFCNRSLMELADDTSAWNWQQAAGNLGQTQKQLQDILRAVRERAEVKPPIPGDPYAIFYHEVANNPMWNGVLFFNAPVDLGLMPPDLKFLAAGIDPTKFYAHHVGFSVTPINASSGAIVPGQTAAFGLIDYVDAQDLVPSSTVPFGFKTLQLKIRFANARIADFSAQCELMVNRLYGAPLAKQDPARGNNLIMNGSCQRVAGVPAYSFVLDGENLFNAQGSAIVSAQVLSVRIDTVTAADADAVTSSFTLLGNLRFRELAAFDMFGYGEDSQGQDGYLRFTGLSIRMQFKMSAPTKQTFEAFESATTLDAANSILRKNAVASSFPLQVSAIQIAPAGVDGKGLTPEQMGFVSTACPLDQTPMSAPWYGLLYTVDLGSLGALSGSLGLSMSVLAAWSTGSEAEPPVYLGLKLASFVRGGGSLPLQGVLKLGFRAFEFIAYQAGTDQLGFQLWMRRFALSVLCWSFPPGNADLVLFGAPGDPGASLGWYAAYDAKPEEKAAQHDALPSTHTDLVDRQLANTRRIPPIA
jgi:hypothetical protein